jgi:hypothetical protein
VLCSEEFDILLPQTSWKGTLHHFQMVI